ncbi:MAG: hypothetical protein H0V70_07755 [Ktedonobacteraceae bacterium]|nr:hypothetical protein [Ktedonobacteraceae bacterium]
MCSYIPETVSQPLHNVLNYAEGTPLREKAGESVPDSMDTPWGAAHTRRQLADGVFWVETEEHGGLLIEREHAKENLSVKGLSFGKYWHDCLAFEQEKDMMVVFYEHPEWYPWMEEELTEQFAEDILRRDHPDYFVM